MSYKLLLVLIVLGFHIANAQNTTPLLILDGAEVSLADLKKMDYNSISNHYYKKAFEAVKQYGPKGRFGVNVLTSSKKPITYRNVRFTITLYFIPDTPNSAIHVANYMGEDLKKIFDRIITEHPKSSLCIDGLAYHHKTDSLISIGNEISFFNLLKCKSFQKDSLSIQMAELLYYSVKTFLSGTIYFSGENFPNVIVATKKDFPSLQNYFGRCAPGSIITFENCIYKNPDGTLSKPLTKTIKLD